MASLYEIRAQLKARLATIDGLRAFGFVPDSLPVPAAFVGAPEEVQFDVTMARGCDRWLIPVRVAVSRATDRHAQEDLDDYLAGSGPRSIKAAIEGDFTLGSVAHSVRVKTARGYGVFTHAGIQYLGAEWLVDVIA